MNAPAWSSDKATIGVRQYTVSHADASRTDSISPPRLVCGIVHGDRPPAAHWPAGAAPLHTARQTTYSDGVAPDGADGQSARPRQMAPAPEGTIVPPSRPRRIDPRLAIPAAALILLALAAVAAITLARRGRDQEPPRAGAFAPPSAARPVVALDVQQARDGTLTLGGPGGSQSATPPSTAAVFVLRPATAADAAPGDWLMVAGIANEVLNFTIRQVVIVPAALQPTADAEGVPRVSDGLAGHEANRDPRERPLLAGRVERTDGQSLTIAARSGITTLDVGAGSPVQRLTAGTLADIREGDRIAYLPPQPGAGAGDARALLVLPSAR